MMVQYMLRVGIDIGSTTIKCAVINENEEIIYKDYKRHKSSITASLVTLLKGIQKEFNGTRMFFNVTGSAGMLLSKDLGVALTTFAERGTKKENRKV